MKKIISMILAALLITALLPASHSTAAEPFRDIEDSWAKREILYLHERGIINGYKDGTFKPNEKISRAQAAAMLLKALGIKPLAHSNEVIKDVPATSYYYPILAAAQKKGIIRGDKGYMRPDDHTTRAQMASILRRAFQLPFDKQPTYIDVPGSYWASSDINTIAKNRIAGGYLDGTFKPTNAVTRAQFSVFLARALDDKMKVGEYKTFISNKGVKVEQDGWVFTARERKIKEEVILPNGNKDNYLINQQEVLKRNGATKEEVILLTSNDLETLLRPGGRGDWDMNEGFGIMLGAPVIIYNGFVYFQISQRVETHTAQTTQYSLLRVPVQGGNYERIDFKPAFRKAFMIEADEVMDLYIWNDRFYFTLDQRNKSLVQMLGWKEYMQPGKYVRKLYSVDLDGKGPLLHHTFAVKMVHNKVKMEGSEFPGNNHSSIAYDESNMFYYNSKGVFKYSLITGKTVQLSSLKAKDMRVLTSGLEIIDESGKKHIIKK